MLTFRSHSIFRPTWLNNKHYWKIQDVRFSCQCQAFSLLSKRNGELATFVRTLASKSILLPEKEKKKSETSLNVDRFCIALFSALEQTRCVLVACDSTWVTVAFYSAFLNIHRSGVFTTLFGCYMAGATWNCCRLELVLCAPSIHPCTSLQGHFM